MSRLKIKIADAAQPRAADHVEPGAMFFRGGQSSPPDVAMLIPSAEHTRGDPDYRFVYLSGAEGPYIGGAGYKSVARIAEALENGGWHPATGVLGLQVSTGWGRRDEENIEAFLAQSTRYQADQPLDLTPGSKPCWMGQPVESMTYSQLLQAFLELGDLYSRTLRPNNEVTNEELRGIRKTGRKQP